MSWFVESKGTKDAVRADVETQFAKNLVSYPVGTPEGDDVEACRVRTLAAIDALVVEDWANALDVKASGSRTNSAAGLMSFSSNSSVTRIHLAL